jgi:hypothetical protein
MATSLKKKEFNYIEKFSSNTKYKPTAFYYCGESFNKACGLPGPVMGSINMFLGHTNTSKTTAMVLTAADAMKKGHLPIFIITERKWSWDHAVELGLEATQNEDGEWVGDFIYNDSFDYIEQVTDFINEIIDAFEEGKINRSIVFLWDSIGSIPCKLTYDGKGGKQHDASVLSDKIGKNIQRRITKSRKEHYPSKENDNYLTMVVVNQPWVELPDNPFGQPEIKAKGGEAVWLASSLVFLFGNQKKSGINHIDATKDGRKITYATRTKISILKNHVNGLGFKDGKIIAVHNGYIDDTKEALDEYKSQYSGFWKSKLGGDFELKESITVDDEEDIDM